MKTTLLLIVSFIFLVMTACNSEKKESKIQTKDALENIMGRKSVRKYLPKPVEKEKVEVTSADDWMTVTLVESV